MLYKSKVARILLSDRQNPSKCQFLRTFVDNLEIKFVRDKGLDHAVEREKHLQPVLNIKNLLKLEPSKSLPISSIVHHNETLKIPYRPIEFIRKFPAVFEEFFPGNNAIHPHIRLTPEILDLDAQEQLIFASETVRKTAAERLLKLLMLCQANQIPLGLIDRFKWDLGLPDNYVTSLVPEFPDYFQVKKGRNSVNVLELVCWSDDLSVSVMEKMAKKANKDYEKGMPIEFPMRYSRGFEMDKKLKKWIEEWQKLPYLSPYENASHLQPNSDMTDRWAVAVLHELLHILGPKKTDRDNILCLGEYLGVKPRLKRAIGHHPGIFYLSSKNRTYTVVLREGYKRGAVVEADSLVDMRGKYIHLMHTAKAKEGDDDASEQKGVEGGAVKENVGNGKAQNEKMQVLGSDEDDSDFDDDDDDEEEEEDEDEDDEVVEEKVRGRGGGRKGYIEENEDDEGDQGRGRGGSRGGRGGFNRGNGERQERGGNRSERGGFNRGNGERQERGGNRSERGGFNRGNGERQERGGNRSEGGGFNRGNGERQERGGNRSERGGFNRGNGDRQERGGNRSEGGGFKRGNGERLERGGNRSERGGFNRGNGERQERGGNRSERGGFSRGNGEQQERGGNRSERGGFKRRWQGKEKRGEISGFKRRGNDEGKERGGNRSGRRESGRFGEERPRSGHGRSGGRGGIRDFGKV